ncbi:hypothetical protein AMS68_003099 [Peltaster fructicola]|uniref:Protein sym1 n=1 Tax=Peltaster fructicola TaxID=286661 RepID=A0A6H0XS40_9PEZI|nr:hypothetical protein AMS68_003099 [Peltaster fructicola]
MRYCLGVTAAFVYTGCLVVLAKSINNEFVRLHLANSDIFTGGESQNSNLKLFGSYIRKPHKHTYTRIDSYYGFSIPLVPTPVGGDTMAQQLVERKGFANHELGRTGRMALYGGAVFGPAATTWFGFLQRRIRIPSSPNLEILARVGADQCIFASANLFVFLSSMAIMEGSDPKQKLESTYWNALQKNWMVWPVVQFTNFKFVPLEHRVLVVNVISLGWNCYLSFLNSQPSGDHEKNPTYPPDS